jgi:HPt (histidine-containing phosphotransfer) domain-containing protein
LKETVARKIALEAFEMSSDVKQIEPLYSSLASDPLLGEIVDMFIDEMPDRVESLQQYHEAGDWEDLRRTAHQLKGAAGSYGFESISPCAAELEDAIRRNDSPSTIDQLLEQLVELCNRVSHAQPQ